MHTSACTYLSGATNFPVDLLFSGPPWRMKLREEAHPLGNSPYPVKSLIKRFPAGDMSSSQGSVQAQLGSTRLELRASHKVF